MEASELVRQAKNRQDDAMEKILALGVESETSVTRWQRSKAPK